MPGYSAERYRQNPPAIGCVIKYYSKEDTDSIVEVFKRVGRNQFSYPDVSDLLPNYRALRRMKINGILEMVRRRHNYVPSTWKFKPELAYRIEKALGEDDEIGN